MRTPRGNPTFARGKKRPRPWRQAADRGFGPAAYEVAACFERGHAGHPRDPATAAAYYARAADAGHGGACRRLSLLHFKGLGVPRDERKAAAYFARAQAAGAAEAATGPAPFAPAAACPRLPRGLDAPPRGLRL